MRYFWMILGISLWMVGSAEATVRYVSNTGTATSVCTTASPASARCHMLAAIAAAAAGDTIEVLAGTITSPAVYLGANYMITVNGKNATSGNAITIKCVDAAGVAVGGGCLLDGQWLRRPISITSSNYWSVIDFNAKHANEGSGSRGWCVLVDGGSLGVVIQRVVAWDCSSIGGGGGAFLNTGAGGSSLTTATLVEDSAFLSPGAITCHNLTSGYVIWRRTLCVNEGSASATAGKEAFNLDYNSPNSRCENCIARWTESLYPATSWKVTDQSVTKVAAGSGGCTGPAGTFCEGPRSSLNGSCSSVDSNPAGFPTISEPYCYSGVMRSRAGTGVTSLVVDVFGSLVYIPNGETYGGQQALYIQSSLGGGAMCCRTIKHTLFYAPSPLRTAAGTTNTVPGLILGNSTTVGNVASNNTVVSPGGITGGTGWSLSSNESATTVAGLASTAQNPWTSTTGANLCFQWSGGVVTSTPLWPWPMNQRIIDATTQAGVNDGPCLGCTGAIPAKPVLNLTAEIESIFGQIAPACRSDAQGGAFPDFTGYPTHGQITAFSGSASPPTGFSTLTGSAWTEGGGVASAGASFGITIYATALSPNQEAWAEITTLPAATGDFGINFLVVDANNRYRAVVTPVSGTNNDTISVIRRLNGSNTTLATIDLGRDMATGDRLGVRVTDSAIEVGYYADWSGTVKWKLVGTATATEAPADSFIGMGALTPTTSTQFGGGADALTDTEAPTAPGNLTVTPNGVVAINLDMDDATDNVAVTEYRIYRGTIPNCSDCTVIGTNTVSSYTDGSATPGTTYYYRVTARDAALNESTASSIVAGRVPDGPAYAGTSGRQR